MGYLAKPDVHPEERREREINFLLASAKKLLEEKETTSALNVYLAVIKSDLNNPEALKGLGACYEIKRDWERALACYERWVRLVPTAESYGRLGQVQIKRNKDEDAVKCFEKAIGSNVDNPDVHYELLNHLGNALLKLNRPIEAEARYLEALKLKPESDRTRINLATLYLQTGKKELATKFYSEAFKLNPRNAKSLCGLGLISQDSNLHEEALKFFTQALEIDWSDLVAINGMIRAGQTLNRFSVIEKYLRNYLSYHPSNVPLLYCLAGNYFHQKKFHQTKEELQKILLLDPYHEAALELKNMLNDAERKGAAHEQRK